MIGPKSSRHVLNQKDAKKKLIVTWSPAFSLGFCTLPVFTVGSHWQVMMQTFDVIGCCVTFVFSF